MLIVGLILLCLLSWWYVLAGAGTGMSTLAMTTLQFPPDPMTGARIQAWGASYWLIMLLMWWVMMIAMMTPSAAPMILLYAQVYRQAQNQGRLPGGRVPTATFLLAYLLAWLLFSGVATLIQWILEQAGLLHGMMMWITNTTLTGSLMLVAGIYQLSPLKNVCLAHCRAPASFISQHFKDGAFHMGFHHGLYCVGCCWFLMALLFAGGIMNLVWIAGLSIVVLLEKTAPWGQAFARTSGVLLILAGGIVLLRL